MDGARFDNMTRALARGTSRRTVLRLLGGGAVAGLAAVHPPTEAGAFICRQPGVLCAKDAHCCSGTCGDDHRCACQDALTLCRRECVDQQTDPQHCGDCTTVCANGSCTQGRCCTPDCTDKECGDDGCGGSCGTCQPPEHCGSGEEANVCVCTPDCAGKACGDADDCGGICQAGSCPGNQTCNAGKCQSTELICGTTTCDSNAVGCCTAGGLCDDGCCSDTLFGPNGDVCCPTGYTGACTSGPSCEDGCCLAGLFGPNKDFCCGVGTVGTCTHGRYCFEGCCLQVLIGDACCLTNDLNFC